MSTLAPPVNSARIVMSNPAVLFAPLGVGYDGSRVDLESPQAGWTIAGATVRAEVRSTYQTKKFAHRVGSGAGTRRILNGSETTTLVVGFHEQDFDLFGLLYGTSQYGGSRAVSPRVYSHRVGQQAEFAALVVEDYDNEASGLDQVVWHFPYLIGTTGLSVDMTQMPLIFDLEAEALTTTVGLPDGEQIETTHDIFHFTL